ncbi:methyltransferase domain-containing protein [PVC group bacterium]|nr:methyltransferase domain-containing protein [PVC group bacterium]
MCLDNTDDALTSGMQIYLDQMKKRFACKQNAVPHLSWACGEEERAAPIHVAFNASAYVVIGQLIQTLSSPPERILDVGCGTGGDTRYFKEHFAPFSSIVGVDRDAALIKFASRTYEGPGSHFETADACCLPFSDESFDLVTAVFSIVHTMSHEQSLCCLKETSRVLKPGGVLIFSTPNRCMSQDHYYMNPKDDPDLMFSPLLRHEYRREDLDALLAPLVGDELFFKTVEVASLVNPAFRPVWRETIKELARRRLHAGRVGALRSRLARRLIPAPYLARYYFRLVREICERLDVTLSDIAQSARFYAEKEQVEADHFVIIARK